MTPLVAGTAAGLVAERLARFAHELDVVALGRQHGACHKACIDKSLTLVANENRGGAPVREVCRDVAPALRAEAPGGTQPPVLRWRMSISVWLAKEDR